MTGIDVITVPYDSGRRGHRMGAGPQHLLRAGLVQQLRGRGHDVELIPVEAEGGAPDVETTTFDLAARVARVVRAGSSAGRFPLLLSGNCIQTTGVVAGLARSRLAVLWLDAHGDMNTPLTSPSGFLDGMGAGVLAGWSHRERANALDLEPLSESRLLLIGTRDLDPGEASAVRESAVRTLTPTEASDATAVAAALDRCATDTDAWYLHIDLDVLDPDTVGRANSFAAPGGLSVDEVKAVINAAAQRAPIAGLTISSYDPAEDATEVVRRAGVQLIMAAVEAAARRSV